MKNARKVKYEWQSTDTEVVFIREYFQRIGRVLFGDTNADDSIPRPRRRSTRRNAPIDSGDFYGYLSNQVISAAQALQPYAGAQAQGFAYDGIIEHNWQRIDWLSQTGLQEVQY